MHINLKSSVYPNQKFRVCVCAGMDAHMSTNDQNSSSFVNPVGIWSISVKTSLVWQLKMKIIVKEIIKET